MLSTREELEGKIHDFIRRKEMQYPELSDNTELNFTRYLSRY